MTLPIRQNQDLNKWDEVYSQKFMTNWYPYEEVIRFCSRFIQKRLTYDTYEVRKKVRDVLDLGCGNGRHAIYFARQGFRAAGIDISPQAIHWAEEWCKREGLEADLRVGDVTSLPYDDASFDVVVSHGVLDHILPEQARRTAEEVRRVLRPQGLFYCDLRSSDDFEHGEGQEVAPNTFVVTGGFEEGLVQHFFTLAEINALFEGLFKIVHIETADHRLAPDFVRKYARWVCTGEAI